MRLSDANNRGTEPLGDLCPLGDASAGITNANSSPPYRAIRSFPRTGWLSAVATRCRQRSPAAWSL
jgi:hypothetical protein